MILITCAINTCMDDYRNWTVYKKSLYVVKGVYMITNKYPPHEKFGLVSQMRRSSVSIVSNIAEGSRRRSLKDKKYFLNVAFGSVSELEAQIEIGNMLNFISRLEYEKINRSLTEVLKMLNKMTSM